MTQGAPAIHSLVMRITWRRSWSAEPERHDVPWEQLVSVLQANSQLTYAPNPDPKYKPLDLPLISFGHFYTRADVPDKYGRPSSWHHDCLDPAGLSAIALDYDGTPEHEFRAVLAKAKSNFKEAGFAHTTWMHGVKGAPGSVRARIILPLTGHGLIELAWWEPFWAMVANTLDATGLDKSCRNPERCYFIPATNPASPWPCWTEVW